MMDVQQEMRTGTVGRPGGQLTQHLLRQIRDLQESLADAIKTGQALRELCDRQAGPEKARPEETAPEGTGAAGDPVATWTRFALERKAPPSLPALVASHGLGRLSERGRGEAAMVVLLGLDAAGLEAAVRDWRCHAVRSGERAVFLIDGQVTRPIVDRRLPFEHLPPPEEGDAGRARLAERRLRIMLTRWQPDAIYIAGKAPWFERLLEAARML